MEFERFASLVTPHTELIARVATTLVGSSDADDAAQEVLLRAWKGWPNLRDADSARAWLMQITYNVCRTWRERQKGLRLSVEERLDSLETLDVGQTSLGAYEHIRALDLREALAVLDEESRLVVLLRFYAGLDSSAIGEMFDVAPATVRGRLRRALQRLRRELGDSDTHQTPSASAIQKEA